jgi:hypothetical protein
MSLFYRRTQRSKAQSVRHQSTQLIDEPMSPHVLKKLSTELKVGAA